MLTRVASLAERMLRAVLPTTTTPDTVYLANASGGTLTRGSLVVVDVAAAGIDTSFNYTRVIAVATAHLAPTAGRCFGVVQDESVASGGTVNVLLEGDTLLTINSGNAAVATLLMGVNADPGAVDATTGNLVIARSKESGTGLKRVYFRGVGICTAA